MLRPCRSCFPALILAMVVLMPPPASAQAFTIEASVERMTILDDTGRVPYNGVGVAARGHIGPRVGLGVGVLRLGRSARDRLLVVEGQLSADLRSSPADRAAVPYIALSVGVMHQALQSGLTKYTNASFIAELTAGVRLRVGGRWFVAPEASLGVTAYPHRRLGIAGGLVF